MRNKIRYILKAFMMVIGGVSASSVSVVPSLEFDELSNSQYLGI